MKALFVWLVIMISMFGLATQQAQARSHECGFLFLVFLPAIEIPGSIGILGECNHLAESVSLEALSIGNAHNETEVRLTATTWAEFPSIWVAALRPKFIVGVSMRLVWEENLKWDITAIRFGVCDELYMFSIARGGICYGWQRSWDLKSESVFGGITFAINL